MNKELTPQKERFLREVEQQLLRRDLDARPLEDGLIHIKWNEKPLCSVDRDGIVRFRPADITGPEVDRQLRTVIQAAGQVKEYMRIFERAPALKAIGLDVTIKVAEFNSFIGDLTSGNYTITALNMTLDGDTQSLEMAFTTDYIGMANNARYSDPEMDELFAQAQKEADTEKRTELFNQAFSKAQDEAIYAVIGNPLELFAYNNSLDVPEIAFEGAYFIYNFSWK